MFLGQDAPQRIMPVQRTWHYLVRANLEDVPKVTQKLEQGNLELRSLTHVLITPYVAAHEPIGSEPQVDPSKAYIAKARAAGNAGKMMWQEFLRMPERARADILRTLPPESAAHLPEIGFRSLAPVEQKHAEQILFEVSAAAGHEQEPRLFHALRDRLDGIASVERVIDRTLVPTASEQKLSLGKFMRHRGVPLWNGSRRLSVAVATEKDIWDIMRLEKELFEPKHRASRRQMLERLRSFPKGLFLIARLHEKGKATAVGYTCIAPTYYTEKTREQLFGGSPVLDMFGKNGIFNPHGEDYCWLSITGKDLGGKLGVGDSLRLAGLYHIARRGFPRYIFAHAVSPGGFRWAAKTGMGLGEGTGEVGSAVFPPVIGAMCPEKTFERVGVFPQEPPVLENSLFSHLFEIERVTQASLGHRRLGVTELAEATLGHFFRTHAPKEVAGKFRHELEQLTLPLEESREAEELLAGIVSSKTGHGDAARKILAWAYGKIKKSGFHLPRNAG